MPIIAQEDCGPLMQQQLNITDTRASDRHQVDRVNRALLQTSWKLAPKRQPT
ncbi:hypothetical protein IscW_ISCW002290 [Ixodes scapularis]|uniref:Uncharacterized protein n=1 Tax=Ixodes scapularis TaxID=6945 RepID=B7PCX7_IXOSC|nr:hypothetical protein IscW_ISCW002290 [Ixodes scapularis]|eukprot:XP_002410430.1 hypothetical protein IscW_ISCW002290 [Ixodes scapularis]